MKIKVWGCRESLPTPGKHTIKYGGNTTCLEIRLKDNTLWRYFYLSDPALLRAGKTLVERVYPTHVMLKVVSASGGN